jgi:transposase
LKSAHRSVKDKRGADRIKSIYLLGTGWNVEDVCEALMVEEETLRNYIKRYREGGVKKLLENNYAGGQAKLSIEQLCELEDHIEQNCYLDVKPIIEYVRKNYGVEYSISGMTEVLHRLNFTYKKPKLIPGKADPKAQEDFLKKYEKIKAKKADSDPILFMDGVHPQHNTVTACGWIKKGCDKEIKSNTGRKRLNINGALNIEEMRVTVEYEETLNASNILLFFKKIRRVYKHSKKIYIICDNAPYYKSREVRKVAKEMGIELIFLPPYSPNLNLIERLWKFFRKKVLHNRYYEKFNDFKNACEDFFKNIRKYKNELQSLLTENFQILGVNP